MWLGVPSKGGEITWVLGSRIKTGSKITSKNNQLIVGKFWNFTSNYCTIAIVNITSIQLGVTANHLDYLRVPTHALGLVALSSAGFTHTAGMSLSPGCSDGSFLFVFLARGHLIFAFFRRIIYSMAFFGLSGTFLHIDFYGTYDWLSFLFYCRRN